MFYVVPLQLLQTTHFYQLSNTLNLHDTVDQVAPQTHEYQDTDKTNTINF